MISPSQKIAVPAPLPSENERSASKLRAWWRDFQDSRRDSSRDEDALIGRALHQHKLHFSEVYGLRRNQPGRIFVKNDRLAFHEVK